MNYFHIAGNFLHKNHRRNFSLIFCCVVVITLHFLFDATIFYNKSIFKVKTTYTLTAIAGSYTNIITILSFLTVFCFNSYMRRREDELRTLLRLGLTRKELQISLALEQFYIILISLGIGLTLGTIFFKLFYLTITKYVGMENNNFILMLTFYKYISTVFFAIILYIIISMRSIAIVKKLEASSKNINLECKSRVKSVVRALFLVLLIILQIYIRYISKKNMHFMLLHINIICVIILYCYIFYINKFLLSNKRMVFNKKLSLIRAVIENIEANKVFIFFISYFGFSIFNYKLSTGGAAMMRNIGRMEMNIINFISIFTEILFFYIASEIILYKFKMELMGREKYYHNLFVLGLTKNEMRGILNTKLKAEFLAPAIINFIISIIFSVLIIRNIHVLGVVLMNLLVPAFLYLAAHIRGKSYLNLIL